MSALRDSRQWAAIDRELVSDPYTRWMKHCLCRSLRPAGERADRQWQALPCRCRKWCGHAVGQGGIGDMGPSEHLIEMARGSRQIDIGTNRSRENMRHGQTLLHVRAEYIRRCLSAMAQRPIRTLRY